jgi:hypothetical protein
MAAAAHGGPSVVTGTDELTVSDGASLSGRRSARATGRKAPGPNTAGCNQWIVSMEIKM